MDKLKLLLFRQLFGLSIKHAAKLVEVHKTMWEKMEKGDRNVSPVIQDKILAIIEMKRIAMASGETSTLFYRIKDEDNGEEILKKILKNSICLNGFLGNPEEEYRQVN